jgi:hypothetical protein
MNDLDFQLHKQVQRLYQLNLYGRWFFVVICWLSLGTLGVWGLRHEFPIWQDYFTWTALRYGLAYNLSYTLCIGFCIGLTASVLVWQSYNLLHGGIAPHERQRLERKVKKIRLIGSRHPLWKWIVDSR